MPADRTNFYLQRKQRILQEKFTAVTAPVNWNYLKKRQASLREELTVLEILIVTSSQSDYHNPSRFLHLRRRNKL